jgi:ligand-binding sensor protein
MNKPIKEESLSEAANWFLGHLQKTLDGFSSSEGIQVVIFNKEGKLIRKVHGVQEICKLILTTKDGKIRCKDHFKTAFSLVKTQRKPIFTECYAGFVSVWIPIIIRESLVGVIVSCGKRYDKGETKKKLEKKFSELMNELEIMQDKDSINKAIDKVSIITTKEAKKRAKKLKELFDILVQTSNTPLKEVLG